MSEERGIMVDHKKNIIGVVGIGRGAGATLVASGLAIVIAQGEGGGAYLQEGNRRKDSPGEKYSAFDQLSLRGLFGKKKMYDLYDLHEEGVTIEGRANLYNRVNWVVHVPEEHRKPLIKQGTKRKHNKDNAEGHLPYRLVGGRTIVVDTPDDIYEMDRLVCVIDPLPSKIKSGLSLFSEVKKLEKTRPKGHILWVINKMNPCVNQQQLEKFLQIKTDCVLGMLQQDVFYFAEYTENVPVLVVEGDKGTEASKDFSDGLRKLAKKIGEGTDI